jgi:hypothetical protein
VGSFISLHHKGLHPTVIRNIKVPGATLSTVCLDPPPVIPWHLDVYPVFMLYSLIIALTISTESNAIPTLKTGAFRSSDLKLLNLRFTWFSYSSTGTYKT